MNDELKNLLKEKGEWIRIYCGVESINDPYEKNVEVTMLNSTPVRAIVTDLTSTQMQYKSAGIITSKAKEIIIKKKYTNLLKASQKIKIQSEYYYGWQTNGQLNFRTEGDYIRCYVYIKKES